MSTDQAIRDAWEIVKNELLDLASDTTGEAKAKLLAFSKQGAAVLQDLVDGNATEAQALEAKDNLVLATRSALINQSYTVQARAVASLSAGLSAVLKIAVALA